MDKSRSVRERLQELRRLLKEFKRQHPSRRRLAAREIVFNWAEEAQVVGISRMTMWRYRQRLPEPPLPAFKSYIKRWAETP